MAAARHWAVGSVDPSDAAALADAKDLLASMDAWNASPADRAKVQAEIDRLQRTADFAVHEDNWPSVSLFLDLETQWRFVGGLTGMVRVGLDYPAALALMTFRGVPAERQAAMFDDLRLMEGAALEAAAAYRQAQAAEREARRPTEVH